MSKDNFVGTAGGRRELYQKNKYYGRKRFLFWWVKKKMPEQPGPSAMFAHIQGEAKEEYDSKRGIGHMIQPDKPWPRPESKEPVEVGIKLHMKGPAEEVDEEPETGITLKTKPAAEKIFNETEEMKEEYDFSDSKVAKETYEDIDE